MTSFDDLGDKYAPLGIGSMVQIKRGECMKCHLPIYYPPKLEKKVVCCPYCRVEFK